ncbi:MAG: DHA2 family efflux MFS transporter permease subunit [Acidimicrobiia bacterium]
MTSHARAAHPVDYSRKWFVMAAIAMGIFLGTIDGSIVNAALPTLETEFGTNFAAVQWIVLGYLLVLATLTMGVGRLGDMRGKRPIYTAGFAVFTVASTLCGLAPGIGWLIGFRIVQGIGSAMIFALGFAILTEAFPASERGRALGLAGTLVSIGVALGPALGGLIIDTLSWRWIFLVNLPIGIVGTWTAWRFVPDVEPPGGQRFDFVGAAAFGAALLAMMLGLTLAQELGFGDALVVGLTVLAVAALVAFVSIERRVAHPMIDLTLFSNRLLSANLVSGWLVFVALAGFLVLAPFYLQDVLGYDTRTMGLLLAAAPIALGVVSPISGAISDRVGPRPVLVTGLGVLVVAYLGLTTLGVDTSVRNWLLLVIPAGLGVGIFQSPNNSAVMGAVPAHRLGVTSAMLTITRIFGQIVGVTVLGTIWAARVSAYSGIADPTEAGPEAQVNGLTDTITVAAAALTVALLVAIWGLVTERRAARAA